MANEVFPEERDDTKDIIKEGQPVPNSAVQSELMYLCAVGQTYGNAEPPEPREDERYMAVETQLSSVTVAANGGDKEKIKQKEELELKKEGIIRQIKDEFIRDQLQILVEKQGALLNVSDYEANTPIHILSQQGYSRSLRWCVQKGAKMQPRGADGGTPLYWAARCRHPDCVRVLVEEGAEVNTRDKDNLSALDIAVRDQHLPTVKVLIDNWAKVTEKTLLLACRKPRNTSLFSNALSILELLIQAKPKLHFSEPDDFGENGLTYTLKEWKAAFDVIWKYHGKLTEIHRNSKTGESTIRAMLENGTQADLMAFQQMFKLKGADVHEKDADGRSLLHHCIENPGMISVLLDNGIDINAVDNDGNTALHLAVQCNDPDFRVRTTKTLIKAGASLNIKNQSQKLAQDFVSGESASDEILLEILGLKAPRSPEHTSSPTAFKTIPQKRMVSRDSFLREAVPNSIAESNKIVIKSGFLNKEGPLVWKKRWFVLTPIELRYFSGPSEEELGTVPLEFVTDLVSVSYDRKMKSVTGFVPVLHALKITVKGETMYAAAESEAESKAWVEAINDAISKLSKETRVRKYTMEENPGYQTDFRGSWILDEEKSDSIEDLLKILGRSWIDRKKSQITKTTLKISQTIDTITINTSIDTDMTSAKRAFTRGASKIGLNLKVPKGTGASKLFEHEETLRLDGTEQVLSDPYAVGKVRVRTMWAEDGLILVSKSELTIGKNKGIMITTRSLENDTTMLIEIQVEAEGVTSEKFSRYFKKKAGGEKMESLVPDRVREKKNQSKEEEDDEDDE
eukprot:TRINITY_DN6466_c0_g1_i1.p1 TRINITY_DN6466_c0_g1~~TRINITY_DN6466_c0_g1_i1.p1  ORF type:complete len:817 (-),score=273.70 TRINITY_DN6466_c0_g1_i1:69-2456(-)